MQLEFHQLERRWEHLRVRDPQRQRRLLASLADSGQQVPIVVVAAEGQADRYVVIDGYKRIAALEQLGRDTVEAVVWPMSEAAAAEQGHKIDDIKKEEIRRDKWVIRFETISSVASGREDVLPFRISNMGSLQSQDICWPLQNAIRTLAPLTAK